MNCLNSFKLNLKAQPITKLIRGLVLSLSVFGLIFYVNECYVKLKVVPEVLVNEKLVNSWTIPFPAVTICVPLLVKKEKLNLTKCQEKLERHEKLDENDLTKLMAYAHVCPIKELSLFIGDINPESEANQIEVLDEMSLKIDEILSLCLVNDLVNCENVYIRSLTDYGYCFSFNMVGYQSLFNEGVIKNFDAYKRKKILKSFDIPNNLGFYDDENDSNDTQWTLDKGYPENEDILNPLPATRGQALKTELKIHKTDISNLSESRSKMIILCLHLPNEIPSSMHLKQYYELDRINALKVSAKIKQNDETLKRFDLKERECFFDGEMSLKYFKSYTKLNCEYECLINFTYEQCGCVKLSMPRSENMRVCKVKDIECYQQVDFGWPVNFFKRSKQHANLPGFPCGCMPSCTQISYRIVSAVSVKARQMNDSHQYSAVIIEFDEAQIIKRTNYVTYKLQNFVSDIGGLISLFLGFSLLSLFELLLKFYLYLKRITNEWIDKLEQESEVLFDNNTLSEVITVQEFRYPSASGVYQSDGVFILPGHFRALLEAEDLNN